MVRLKSRTQCPVGGFQFTQPETGANFHTWDFTQIVTEIQNHRAQNPRFKLSLDPNVIAGEVDLANAQRMLSIRNADSYVTTDEGAIPKMAASRSLNWRSAVGGVKRVVAGANVLRDWLGEGGVPVDAVLADARAAVCAGCPQNHGGDWLSKFTKPASERIRAQVALRQDMKMTTPDDARLEFCEACSCPLKLKVHVPLEFIVAHQSEETQSRLDARCWILKEMTA